MVVRNNVFTRHYRATMEDADLPAVAGLPRADTRGGAREGLMKSQEAQLGKGLVFERWAVKATQPYSCVS